jgi:trehalose 6-phosphate synthase
VPARPIVIVSNRGPLSFAHDESGALVAKRGGGGLVSGLAPLVAGTDAMWLAAAMSEPDREAARHGLAEADGLRVQLLDVDPATYRMAYDVICNATLWFCFHGLFDLARRPRIDMRWREAWGAYRELNAAFARATAEIAPEGAAVLIQDYHLALMGPMLRNLRPDVRTVHFSHTPFCWPDGLVPLPEDARHELVHGMAGNHATGFHTARWAEAFDACARAAGVEAMTYVSPLAADPEDLAAAVGSDVCRNAQDEIRAEVGDRKLLVRVDRIELSKNLLRGFHAFDDLLVRHPHWRERVVFAAHVYPSREGLPEYLAYRQETEGLARQLNERWATAGWTPITFDPSDDFPRSVAALSLADVVLVNPIRDGLNLVAKEGVLVNDRSCALVLSTEAGAWDELGGAGAIGVNPFDVSATADALDVALSMDDAERARRWKSLHDVAAARTPRHWLAEQLAAAGET